MSKKKKPVLFDIQKQWEIEWQDMPEFVQYAQKPYDSITISFKTKKDMKKFFKKIGQKIPKKLKSIWYPKIRPQKIKRVYTDES